MLGFILFLTSEVMLFGGFFWSYFDRVYNCSSLVGSFCLPQGVNPIDFLRWPLIGTIVLLTSGYYANQSYYSLRSGSYVDCILSGYVTISLGLVFLCIQIFEYDGLALTISDTVFGSFFYLLTGFHGFHVTIGILFLCDQYGRLVKMFKSNQVTNRNSHIGFAFGLIYWHFVDIV